MIVDFHILFFEVFLKILRLTKNFEGPSEWLMQ